MRRFFVVTAFIALVATPVRAQQRLVIDIPGLADRAAETTDVTLDGSMLRFAAKFLNDDDDRLLRYAEPKVPQVPLEKIWLKLSDASPNVYGSCWPIPPE